MRIFLFVILSSLLMGCSDDSSSSEGNLNKEIVNIEEFKQEIKYNELHNSFAGMKGVVEAGDGAIFKIKYDDKTGSSGHYFMYYDDGESTILNSSASNGCDIENIEKCTSYFPNIFFETFMYYDSQIYYVSEGLDTSNDSMRYYLSRCDIDGTNREKVLQIEIPEKEDRTSPGYSLHKGKLYVTCDNKLYIYNLNDEKNKVIEYDKSSNVTAIYLYDDIAYVNVENYKDDDDNRLKEALIKMDLNTYEQEIMYENVPIYFVDETNLISVDKNEDEVTTYLQNHETGEKVILTDGYATYRLKENGKYILGKYHPKNGSFIMTFDEQGNLLKEVVFDDSYVGHAVIDGKFYLSLENGYHYFDINNESNEFVKLAFE